MLYSFPLQKTCTQCGTEFEIADEDLRFYEQISPVFNGKRYLIPPPKYCPDCRQQRRLLICNEFTLFSDNCDMCGKHVITEFKPDRTFPIYCRPCYLSDKWDQTELGQDVDFNRPFFEQMKELFAKVPNQHLNVDGEIQNSEYIHYAGTSKNSYLIMHADFCEDCYYGYGFKDNRNCVDGFYNLHCDHCYDCVTIHRSHSLTCCQDCTNCNFSSFLRDCIGCSNCFLCVGLRQKEYCFENEQLTKEEYQKKMEEIDLGSYSQYQEFKKRRRELELKHTFKEFFGHNTQDSLGDYLQNCKEAKYCFDCEDVESCKYCYQLVLGSKSNYDVYQFGTNLQQSYQGSIIGENSYHILSGYLHYQGCNELSYCMVMDACKHCFGCTNMRCKSYCILNKQYTKEEYEELVPKIIEHMQNTGEWGEFLPPFLANSGYNETTAQLYYPLEKEEALKLGFKWSDYKAPEPEAEKIISADQLPDNIEDIPEEVTDWAIRCEESGKLFKLTKQEYKFYKEHKLPVPHREWFQRHKDRLHLRNPRHFWDRTCGKCGEDIKTTYSPDRPEIVYCEACYHKEVYG